MNFIFHFIYGIILPIDELIFFRGVETTNQSYFVTYWGFINAEYPQMDGL